MHSESTAGSDRRRSVRQPTRGADRNRTLVDRTEPTGEDVLLPSLETGITLLDVADGRGVPVVQSLVLDHLLTTDGPAFWVDANGHATTTTLARVAPSRRLLDRIHVARGFTAYQHYGALRALPAAVNRHIRTATRADGLATRRRHRSPDGGDTSPQTPALVVAPALDAHYRTADTLSDGQARTLQARALASLADYAEGYDVPVLVTRTARDDLTEPIETAADAHLTCERTRMGPRIAGEGFETLVYPVDDGAYYQTTFAYWRQVLAARADQVGLAPAGPDPAADEDAVGTGVTADGATASLTANPLLDAWAGPAEAGGR